MILFFLKGKIESDRFIKHCYAHYRDIVGTSGKALPDSLAIIRDDGKKPRFDSDEVYFSLSHSNAVLMLGISHAEIGVDIEKIREIDLKKFKFIDAENIDDFFERWTERESYLKWSGQGLANFKCEIPNETHFEHFPVFEDFDACVCAEEQNVIAYEIDINAID